MSHRNYRTKPSMLRDPYTESIIQPDASLIRQLHSLLDMLNENHALAIDHIVSELIAFKNPNRQMLDEIFLPEQPKEQS